MQQFVEYSIDKTYIIKHGGYVCLQPVSLSGTILLHRLFLLGVAEASKR